MAFELYFPVKDPINQNNLFGTSNAMYTALKQKGHPGIDFESKLGTPLYAPCDGDAFYCTDQNGGDGFWIRYPNNAKPQYDVILWHMPNAGNPTYPFQIPAAKGVVTSVKAGQFLGYTGNSGYPKESTGPHLHLGVLPCDFTGGALAPNNGYLGCVDPMPFFNGKYAQDIGTVQAIVQTTAEAVQAISTAPIPAAQKAQDLGWLAQALQSVRNWLQK